MKLPSTMIKQLEAKGLIPARKRRPREKKTPRPKPTPCLAPSVWTIIIPNYLPPSLSVLLHCGHRKKMRLKKEARQLIGWYGKHVPAATGKIRVLLTLTRPDNRGLRDDDNSYKAILDGLKTSGFLVDDNPDWCECPKPVQIVVKGERHTTIILEEL